MVIFIIGIGSDIGTYFARKCIGNGHSVFGTYRNKPDEKFMDEINTTGGRLIHCDFCDKEQIENAIESWTSLGIKWDLLLSAVGVLSPVGLFSTINIDEFESSIYVNSISQFRFLRGILGTRNPGAKVFFLTSRGVHDPFPEHAAYCLSKIVLVKMCEILDDEIFDCSFIALNPGYIPTKIVSQDKGAKKLTDEEREFRLNRVYDFIYWAFKQEKAVVSGRNFFIEYDPWQSDSLVTDLIESSDKYKLRRSKDTWNEKEKRFEHYDI